MAYGDFEHVVELLSDAPVESQAPPPPLQDSRQLPIPAIPRPPMAIKISPERDSRDWVVVWLVVSFAVCASAIGFVGGIAWNNWREKPAPLAHVPDQPQANPPAQAVAPIALQNKEPAVAAKAPVELQRPKEAKPRKAAVEYEQPILSRATHVFRGNHERTGLSQTAVFEMKPDWKLRWETRGTVKAVLLFKETDELDAGEELLMDQDDFFNPRKPLGGGPPRRPVKKVGMKLHSIVSSDFWIARGFMDDKPGGAGGTYDDLLKPVWRTETHCSEGGKFSVKFVSEGPWKLEAIQMSGRID